MSVDFSALPPPQVIEPLDHETLFQAALIDFRARFLAASGVEFTALRDSDPVYHLLQVEAFRELVVRQRVNDDAAAVLLPRAQGADLDNLSAFFGVTRLVGESDTALRRRTALAPGAYSVAGPRDAYLYHALTVSPDIEDAAVSSPRPGDILVTLLVRDGADGAALMAAVGQALSDRNIRPMGDSVTVELATFRDYAVEAALRLPGLPTDEVAIAGARAALTALTRRRVLGGGVIRSALIAAAHAAGIVSVSLAAPAEDISASPREAPRCLGVTITEVRA